MFYTNMVSDFTRLRYQEYQIPILKQEAFP